MTILSSFQNGVSYIKTLSFIYGCVKPLRVLMKKSHLQGMLLLFCELVYNGNSIYFGSKEREYGVYI